MCYPPRMSNRLAALFLLLGLAVSTVAVADVLVLKDGTEIETKGPWDERPSQILFHNAEGKLVSIGREKVDLEASARRTAEEAEADRAEVTVYVTEWCGYCRKTLALLRELDVPFEALDVEKDAAASREHLRLTRGRGSVPVTVIGDEVIHGFQEARLRELLTPEESGKAGNGSGSDSRSESGAGTGSRR